MSEGGREGIILCYGNYGVGAYGMDWLHNKEPSGQSKAW